MQKKVLFTDIDGTLTNILTGEYLCSKAIVKKLKQIGVPVILCSAKTMAEQEPIRVELELKDPFIVENGGAIVVPEKYFTKSVISEDKYKRVRKFLIVELGESISVIREKLDFLRNKFKMKFSAVGDISVGELSNLTGLKPQMAKLMAERRYTETILRINREDLPQFSRRAHLMGLNVIYGGKFIDVTAGTDKGKAVTFMKGCFRRQYGKDTIFFGIGDSPNDAPMLNKVDISMLVQKPNRTWALLNTKKVIKLPGIGPNGLKYVLELIMKKS